MHATRVLFKQLTRNIMTDSSLTVQVTQGTLRGAKAKSKFGEYVSFSGIPYAKPPVGPLRFRAPQAAESWSGVRDAIKEGEMCPQRDLYTQQMRGNEDCLFLNIHTPGLPTSSGDPLKPVMVWIHGGSFTIGHGNIDFFGPDFLLREDVLVVTFNYRVGAFGFLNMKEAGVSANAGLKDQVFALRWVKENIASFGGDPNNVTLCGDSAGGCAASYHCLSPMSRGLFQRAISFSGTANVPYAFMDTQTSHKRAFALGEAMGIKTNNPQELIDHLMKQPAMDIAKNLNKSLNKLDNQRGAAVPLLPTVELNPDAGEEVFLPDTPTNILLHGTFQRIPYILGTSSHEGALLCRNVIHNPKLWQTIDNEFEKCITIPLDLNIERYSDKSRALAAVVKKHYFGDEPLSEKHLLNYCLLLNDIFFNVGIHDTLNNYVKYSPHPTYMLEFAFDGSLGLHKKFVGAESLPGACHGDISCHIFKYAMLDYDLPPDSREMKAVNTLVKLLTNFAKTGDPTPKSDSSLNFKWERATPENKMAYLQFGDEIVLKSDRVKESLEFWADKYGHFGNKFAKVSSHL